MALFSGLHKAKTTHPGTPSLLIQVQYLDEPGLIPVRVECQLAHGQALTLSSQNSPCSALCDVMASSAAANQDKRRTAPRALWSRPQPRVSHPVAPQGHSQGIA